MKGKTLVVLGLVMSLIFGSFAMAEVPISHEIANINGVQTLTQVYEVKTDIDPNTLIQEDLQISGYNYTLVGMTKRDVAGKSHTVSQVVELPELASKNKDDALREALTYLQPTLPFTDEETGLEGELALVPGSVKIETVNERTVYGSKSMTKTYTYEYNDNSQVPKSADGYNLQSVSWTDGELDEDGMMPKNYIATAVYTKSTSSVVNDGYVARAEYKGEVKETDTVQYTLVYEGERERVGLAKTLGSDTLAGFVTWLIWIVGGALILALLYLIFKLIRMLLGNIITINYRDEFSGEEKKLAKMFLGKDRQITIDTAKHPECNHYTVLIKKRKANELTGQPLHIKADLKYMDHVMQACYGKEYQIPVNLEEEA